MLSDMKKLNGLLFVPFALALACEPVDYRPGEEEGAQNAIALEDVARIMSALEIGPEQVREVYDAVSSSSENGYDNEYLMSKLFSSPGAGVGEDVSKAGVKYERPLRDLLSEFLRSGVKSAADCDCAPEEMGEWMIDALENSDIQIYWPFFEQTVAGGEHPAFTFDPDDGSSVNIAWQLSEENGERILKSFDVDEDYARNHPVWVINRNDDSGFRSLEMLRRESPDWGNAGGSIIVGTKVSGTVRSLILKDFLAKRNYDSWFAGGSEFFVKIGTLDNFHASTEAELQLFEPTITDFMISVRRNEVGVRKDFNAMLISDWSDQLESFALMVVEDDGGKQTSWKTEGEVKINSKTWGYSVTIPLNIRDDIVWRGTLSSRYLEKYAGATARFGDIELCFDFMEL